MKQQYDALEITILNRSTGVHNEKTSENLPVKLMDEIWDRIKEMEKEFEKTWNFTDHLDSRIGEMCETFVKIEEKIQSIEDFQSELQVQVNTMKADYKALEEKFSEMKRSFTSSEINFKKEIYDINLYIVMFLVSMLIAAIFAITKLLPQIQPENYISKERVGGQEQAALVEDIVKRLSKTSREKGIGIISFNSSTHKFHMEILKTVTIPISLTMHDYVVESIRDLFKVTPHEIFIIFVDSNERNIILENPEIEIGDLRRQTTEIIMKNNCDVFLIYCKNKGSASLLPSEIFNTSLQSIYQRPILSSLRNKNRVLSVYDSFHPQQVTLLENRFKKLEGH